MKLLLDTHIFLWLIDDNQRLSEKYRQAIQNPNNDKFLSVVSIWECVIKYQVGKLDFPSSPETYLPQQRRKHLIKTLTVDENSIAQLVKLPLLHKDTTWQFWILDKEESSFESHLKSLKASFFCC